MHFTEARVFNNTQRRILLRDGALYKGSPILEKRSALAKAPKPILCDAQQSEAVKLCALPF